jgi:hypothetical protein
MPWIELPHRCSRPFEYSESLGAIWECHKCQQWWIIDYHVLSGRYWRKMKPREVKKWKRAAGA